MDKLSDFSTQIDGIPDLTLRSGIQHLKSNFLKETEKKPSLILVEAGASTTLPAYDSEQEFKINYSCDGNPVDTLVLSLL
jgi:hypothetical protein